MAAPGIGRLNRLSAAWPNPFTRWIASHGTPRRLKRGVQALACAVLCLWVFSIAMPLFAVTPPVVVRQETPELVNTVSFDADTALYSLELNWVRGPITVRAYDGESIIVNEYAKQGLKTDEKGRITLFRGNLAVDWNNDLIALDSGVAGGLYQARGGVDPAQTGGRDGICAHSVGSFGYSGAGSAAFDFGPGGGHVRFRASARCYSAGVCNRERVGKGDGFRLYI